MSKLLPKHRFEEIKKAQRQAKLDKRRKIAVRNVSVSFLIVCEGERTEPNYFKALIKDRYSDIREVTIEGKGQGTVSLIKETMAIRNKSNKEFDRVWAVFDKDDFNDFNDAIRLAHKIIFFVHGLMNLSNYGIIYTFNIWIPAYLGLNILKNRKRSPK